MNNQRKQTKLILRIIGFALLVVGLTLSAIGFANFGNFENNLFLLTFIGLPCTAVGIGFAVFSFSQDIARFIKNEHAPIINELSKEISPAIENYASAVKDGFLDDNTKLCSCGNKNPMNAKFCSNCGSELVIVCPNCKTTMNPKSKYCNECGTKLD